MRESLCDVKELVSIIRPCTYKSASDWGLPFVRKDLLRLSMLCTEINVIEQLCVSKLRRASAKEGNGPL